MSETNKKIFELIPKVIASVKSVGKNRKSEQGYWFRGIDDLMAAVRPALVENNIFIMPQVIEHQREQRPTRDNKGSLNYSILTVKHTFFAPDGSSVECITVGEAMDSGDKSSNKAMSAAMKYALIEVFCITIDLDDPDAHDPRTGYRKPEQRPPQRQVDQRPRFNGQPIGGRTGAPFPPATQADQLIADANAEFQQQMDQAFRARGFNGPSRDEVLTRVCTQLGINHPYEMTADSRAEFFRRLNSGRYDRYKSVNGTAAALA
jgi:ERF superfamily protein